LAFLGIHSETRNDAEDVMYKFLAYEWPIDWDAVDIDHIVDIAIKTQCQMCVLDSIWDENGFSFWVFGFAYLSLDNLATFIGESGFRKGRWFSITQEQYLRGLWTKLQDSVAYEANHGKIQSWQLDFSEAGREKTTEFFQIRKWEASAYSRENREFHAGLKTIWKSWPVFTADWKIEFIHHMSVDERDILLGTWQNMYQDAQMLGSLLGFATLRTPRTRRLFLPLPFYELLTLYIEQVAPHLPVSDWSMIEHKDIPNTVQTHNWMYRLTGSID
jgi:hypothetical protein